MKTLWWCTWPEHGYSQVTRSNPGERFHFLSVSMYIALENESSRLCMKGSAAVHWPQVWSVSWVNLRLVLFQFLLHDSCCFFNWSFWYIFCRPANRYCLTFSLLPLSCFVCSLPHFASSCLCVLLPCLFPYVMFLVPLSFPLLLPALVSSYVSFLFYFPQFFKPEFEGIQECSQSCLTLSICVFKWGFAGETSVFCFAFFMWRNIRR